MIPVLKSTIKILTFLVMTLSIASVSYSDSGDVDRLIRDLSDEIDIVSIKAINELGRMKEKRALKRLIQLAFSRNQDVSSAAINALKNINDPGATEILANMFKSDHGAGSDRLTDILREIDPAWYDSKPGKEVVSALLDRISSFQEDASADPRSIEQSVLTLGATGAPSAVDALIPLLQTKARKSAIIALERIGGDAAKSELIKIFNGDDEIEKMQSAYYLAGIGYEPAVDTLIGRFDKVKPLVGYDIIKKLLDEKYPHWEHRKVSQETVSRLKELLADGHPGTQMFAAKILLMLNDESAVKPITDALNDNNIKVRMKAIQVLGVSGSPLAVEPLLTAIDDKDPNVRGLIVSGLRNIGDPRAVKPLIGLLGDEDKNVKYIALNTLGEMKDSRAVEPIIKLLLDPDRRIRGAAATALGIIDDKRAVMPLIELLKKNHNVTVTIKALNTLGDKHAVDAILPYLYVINDIPRYEAYKALENIDPDWRNTDKARSTVSNMRFALQSNTPNTRRVAAWALGRLGDNSVQKPLIKLLKDKDENARKNTLDALWRLDPGWAERKAFKDFLEKLKKALYYSPEKTFAVDAVNAYVTIGERSVQPLIEASKEGDAKVRANAVKALGLIRDPRGMDTVLAALSEDEPIVKNAAADALGDMKGLDNPAAIDTLIDMIGDDRYRASASRALIGMRARAALPLIKALDKKDEAVRDYALTLLLFLSDITRLDPELGLADKFVKLIPEVNARTKVAIVKYILMNKNPRLPDVVNMLFSFDDQRLTREVVTMLTSSDDPRAMEVLRGKHPDISEQTSGYIKRVLKEIDDKEKERAGQ